MNGNSLLDLWKDSSFLGVIEKPILRFEVSNHEQWTRLRYFKGRDRISKKKHIFLFHLVWCGNYVNCCTPIWKKKQFFLKSFQIPLSEKAIEITSSSHIFYLINLQLRYDMTYQKLFAKHFFSKLFIWNTVKFLYSRHAL